MPENSPKRRKIAPLGTIPTREKNVFLPVSAPDLTHHTVSFVRASPAVGKSTLGHDMAVSDRCTYCQLWPNVSVKTTLLGAVKTVVRSENPELHEALQELRGLPDHVLVIDEAHLLFADPVCDLVLKSGVKILLMSASAEARQSSQITPADVTQKLLWKPRIQVTEDVVNSFREAGLNVNLDVLKLLANLCSHIKGVFMHAINFFHEMKRDCSDLTKAILQIKHNQFEFDSELQNCRAVTINGGFDIMENEEFIKVLLRGPTKNIQRKALRDLCIQGALLPVCVSDEYTPYRWNDDSTVWGVSNHLMADYYVGILKEKGYKIRLPKTVSSGSDVIVRALPSIGFRKVVQKPIFGEDETETKKLISNLSTKWLPHEDHYNDALYGFLTQFYDVSRQKGSEKGVGSPDLAVATPDGSCIVIETVLWTNDIEKHRDRFDAWEAYQLPKLQCLLIIGLEKDDVQQKVKNTKGGKVEIVGVVVTHSHHEYQVFVKQAGEGSSVEGPFAIPCDCVARSLKPNPDGKLELQCCQDYDYTAPGGPSEVWVQRLTCNGEAGQGPFVLADEDAFRVRGRLRDIDDLKNGIMEKTKLDPKTVYRKEEGAWKKVSPNEEIISGKTMESSYGFVVSTAST